MCVCIKNKFDAFRSKLLEQGGTGMEGDGDSLKSWVKKRKSNLKSRDKSEVQKWIESLTDDIYVSLSYFSLFFSFLFVFFIEEIEIKSKTRRIGAR